MSDVTEILSKIEAGDKLAASQLLPLVYDELRKLAYSRLASERPGQTLQATALVHEAFLRLVKSEAGGSLEDGRYWNSRGHFFAAAAEAMRRILVEAARRKQREKHGGGMQRVDLDIDPPAVEDPREDLVALDEALTRLEKVDPQAAKLVELLHFGGLTIKDAARILDTSPRTVDRLWRFARAWLHRELVNTPADPRA